MNIKKAGIAIFTVIMFIIFVLLFMRSCSISKRNEEEVAQNKTNNVVVVEESKTAEKEEKTEKVEKTENKKEEKVEEKVDKKEEKTVEKANSEEVLNSENSDAPVFKKSEEPSLSDSNEIEALVSSKGAYLVDESSYAYSVNIVIPIGEGYDVIKYFCPKKTYDAVSSGEVIKVSYSIDKNGIISISHITK